jgi:hypothetical protein
VSRLGIFEMRTSLPSRARVRRFIARFVARRVSRHAHARSDRHVARDVFPCVATRDTTRGASLVACRTGPGMGNFDHK